MNKQEELAELTEQQEADELLEEAWSIMAKAYDGNWNVAPRSWRGPAGEWRDKYHAYLDRYPLDKLEDISEFIDDLTYSEELEEVIKNEPIEVVKPWPHPTTAAVDLAKYHGIDLKEVVGTGSNGRITVFDVRKVIAEENDETKTV